MTLFVERQTIFRRTPNDFSSNVKRLFVERQTIVRRTSNDGNTFESPCDYSEKVLRLQ